MFYRTDDQGKIIDYSAQNYHKDCLYTDKNIVVDEHGQACFEDEIEETYTYKHKLISKQLGNIAQQYMDKYASYYDYDSCNIACSYIDTGVVKYDAEGAAFRKWRSAVWEKVYQIVDDVAVGNVEMPDQPTFVEQLPLLRDYLQY